MSNIRDLIDEYCYYNLYDQPETEEEYIEYAERFASVGRLTPDELADFKLLLKTDYSS